MGFCLFEHAEMSGTYFAVNPAHVAEVTPQGKAADGRPVSLIKLSCAVPDFQALAVGAPDDIRKTLMDGSKIGLNKVEICVLAGRNVVKPQSLVFNHPQRVVLVRELPGDQLPESDGSFVTASQLFLEDGDVRLIVERPGIFSRLVNAKGKVPVLEVRP